MQDTKCVDPEVSKAKLSGDVDGVVESLGQYSNDDTLELKDESVGCGNSDHIGTLAIAECRIACFFRIEIRSEHEVY